MEDKHEQQGIFHSFGKGVFWALVLFVLPAYVVMTYKNEINAWLSGVSELPVYVRMQDDFLSGAQVVGTAFEEKLRHFYQSDSTINIFSVEKPLNWSRQWNRQAVEQKLDERFSSGKMKNARAYLDYVETYKDIALREMQRTKIPASVTLAQGILETDAGRGYLATEANNHFGIKCRLRNGYRRDGRMTDDDFDHHSLAIGCVQRHDDYYWDRFEVYGNADASYRRHSILLQGERYRWMIGRYRIGEVYPVERKLFGHERVPYYAAWSLGLKQSGYATSKTYAETLTLIIETYQLWRIDYELVISES